MHPVLGILSATEFTGLDACVRHFLADVAILTSHPDSHHALCCEVLNLVWVHGCHRCRVIRVSLGDSVK